MKMKNLSKYRTGGTSSKMTLAVPLPKTPDGRVYRYSPNLDAHPRHFVLGNRVDGFVIDPGKQARMKQAPGSPFTVCPYSGVVAKDAEFTHPDDAKAGLKLVEHAVLQDATAAISDMLKSAARRSKGSLTYKPGKEGRKLKPRFGRRDLMRLLICDDCGRDYGVFAIGLYCPDCGAPNVAIHFSRETELVVQQVELAEGLDKSVQELAYRLMGNAHEDVLTAFEATLKTVYLHKASQPASAASTKPVGNAFQNIDRGKARFAEFGFDPFSLLSTSELKALELNIQKRHVIGHNLGVIDAKFAQTAADAKLGETVKLVGVDIRAFANLAQKVVDRLDLWLADQNVLVPAPVEDDPEEILKEDAEASVETIGDLGSLATKIGTWFCKASTTGLPEHIDEDALLDAFAHEKPSDIEVSLAELELDGLVTLTHVMNTTLPRIRTTAEFFLTFDPIVLETHPMADAMKLIELVLAGDNSIKVFELHTASGLPLRRFNPAVTMVVEEVGEGRVSREGSPDYPVRYFHILAEDKVALMRLAKRLQE